MFFHYASWIYKMKKQILRRVFLNKSGPNTINRAYKKNNKKWKKQMSIWQSRVTGLNVTVWVRKASFLLRDLHGGLQTLEPSERQPLLFGINFTNVDNHLLMRWENPLIFKTMVVAPMTDKRYWSISFFKFNCNKI